MMIYEFRELLPEGVTVTDDEYRMIEDMYMWYPVAIDKKQIADLYATYGMTLIRDMLPRADKMKELYDKKKLAEHEIWKIERLEEAVAGGYDLNLLQQEERKIRKDERKQTGDCKQTEAASESNKNRKES